MCPMGACPGRRLHCPRLPGAGDCLWTATRRVAGVRGGGRGVADRGGRRAGRHERRREIAGMIDGRPPARVESSSDVADRKALLRTIGYKL
ncbi:adenosine-specific kinase [Rhodococcus aetherivorans]